MSKLNIDKKTVKDFFENKKADYLISNYRLYKWGEKECLALWKGIFSFVFPDNDYSKFDVINDEYFLGKVITFRNENDNSEVFVGKEQLITLMLLLRALYPKLENMHDDNSQTIRENIETCIWKTGEFGKLNKNALKINLEVATDNDGGEFRKILSSGVVTSDQKSNYAKNFNFFQNKIDEFKDKFPGYFSYLPYRILNNCILLYIEAESKDTALKVLSKLNDR